MAKSARFDLSDDEIVQLEIPTGIPLVYVLDERLKPLKHRYLGDPEKAKKRWHLYQDKEQCNDGC